jgi:hypothetical protein
MTFRAMLTLVHAGSARTLPLPENGVVARMVAIHF